MSEDQEVALNKEMVPKEERAQTVDRPRKALTPIVSASGLESNSSSSMEQLLQEVRTFVVSSDPGAAEATSPTAPTSLTSTAAAKPPTAAAIKGNPQRAQQLHNAPGLNGKGPPTNPEGPSISEDQECRLLGPAQGIKRPVP